MGVVFALGGELGLVAVDPGLVIGTVDAGDAVEGVVLGDRSADETVLEDVGQVPSDPPSD